jgi:UDP-N-acetylmuramoyl-tripeptide--D-alanyl-D-alanine ligase
MTEPLWTFKAIGAAVGSAVFLDGTVSGVSIDSRTLHPGDLFVAIKGERADGHHFLEAAFKNGATAAIADASLEFASQHPLFRVPDTLEALNALAAASRTRSQAKITAVTGSAGKTGTKEMLRLMLAPSGLVHASEKSYNNLWGVPLSLARMPRAARFGVFEIGMNHAGEITPLTQLVKPHIAIVTSVAAVHLEFFNSVGDIADAKAEIFEGLEQGGAAILPAGSEFFERLAAHARLKGAEIIPFGETAGAAARLLSYEALHWGSRVTAGIFGSRIEFMIGASGKHLASNALAALAAVKVMGADLQEAAETLGHFQAPEGRGRQERLESPKGGVLLIDETYNANPSSMRAALEVLGSTERVEYPRRIAVLGDMLELGRSGAQLHEEIASVIAVNDIDLVFCAGPLMEHLYRALPSEKRGAVARSSSELVPAVLNAVRAGDAVTVKGSLGSRMAILSDALRAHFVSRPQ